ncbi:hypothetical protein BC830DRAFT_935622 [Chytriomyces sp. MP71]|nr:hypothetical protein BC830DRAFT_935622 [Chytriomyces sp. MP71]
MAEVDELRQKLQVAESAPESAQPSSTPSIAQLERELDQANAEIVALNAKLETAEASAAATTVQTSSSTEVAELEEELEEATAQIIELRKKLEIAETTSAQATKGDDVSEEVDDLKTHLSSAKEEIQELKAQLEQVSGAGLSAEDTAKISDLEAQLDDSRQEADELFARVQELESLASGSNLDELQRLLNEEKMRSSTLDATNKSLTTEVTSLHERLARQTELSKADVDTQAVIDKLEAEIEQLKSELDNNLKAYDELEAQYSESENVNKELNHSLDLADQEIETLNRELDDVYAADTVKELEETKVQLADCLAKLQNGGSGASSVDGGADVDALVEDRVKTREDDFVKLEAELRSQIEIVEEQAREGKASLVQQLQDQQEDAKEMRETLVARLRQQESEAATLREDLSKLQVDFSETTSNLKTIEKGFDDFRVRAQGLEKRYLERVEFVEAALDQTYAEIESLRSQIIQSAKDQGVEPPTFKPLEPLPPANYDDKEEVYDAPKTGFLSSLWKGRRPTVTSPKEDKKKELPGRVVATPQPTDEPRTVSSPTPSITAGKDGKNNKQSTGILSSLWGGRGKNPEGASDSQTAIQTSTLVPEPSPSEPVATAATSAGVVNVKDVVVGADDDDVPQQPPSKFLASIWGAKTKLKRTDSEIV